jgi:hypothetical protein
MLCNWMYFLLVLVLTYLMQALDLLAYAKRGTARSKLWLVKVIGQLYDVTHADEAGDVSCPATAAFCCRAGPASAL